MHTDPIRMCELLVGLPAVNVLGIDESDDEGPLRVHVEARTPRPFCVGCAVTARVKDRPRVELVDLSVFGQPARLVWHKHRWCCPNPGCLVGSWTWPRRGVPASSM